MTHFTSTEFTSIFVVYALIWIAILYSFFQGQLPLYVSATAGTTVYGAYDPLVSIADICEKYNIWMHVDVRFLSLFLNLIL